MKAFRRGWGGWLVLALFTSPAIALAAGRLPWVLVDTGALTLTVFSGDDHVLARFHNISIGSGGVSNIHRRGDDTTPLGSFHVAWIDLKSRYGFFYGLDYPNEGVARRAYAKGIISAAEFDAIVKAAKRHRRPPQDTPLGGELGLHGTGRGDPQIHKAVNWTDGCIALTNHQMRRLSRWMRMGTRVVIR